MINWKTKSKELILKSDSISVIKANVETSTGKESEYYYTDSPGSVMIIPIKPGTDVTGHKYIMVRQYRYPVGSYDLEFPAGRREPKESILDAGLRELKEETGYDAKEIKLLYSMHSNPGSSNGTTSICIATVLDNADQQELDEKEKEAALKVEELSSDDLHKKIMSMDITDPHTLAAVCAFIMNSKTATKYLNGDNSEEQ